LVNPSISIKFLTCTLRRQAASCIFGLAPFVKTITDRGLAALATGGALIDDTEITDEFDDASGTNEDLSKLKGFKDFADRINAMTKDLPSDDNKFDTLAEVIRSRQGLEKNKTIIFTSFRHTISYLRDKLTELGIVRIGSVDGSVNDEDRYDIRERFALPKDDRNALDVLLFTEVGSEGLDYQICDAIVNYDIPWNPMRVEQRIGRIDRRGQKSGLVQIYNCITEGTIDKEIFERCLERIHVFEQSIGDCDSILGKLEQGIRDIMLSPNLTEDERRDKMEKLADNGFTKIQEIRRLEDEAKQLFGVDISSFTSEVANADNPWLSPDSLKRLVGGYLERKFGVKMDGNKIKLTEADKIQLKEKCKALKNIRPNTMWSNYLQSPRAVVANITFNQEDAKNPKIPFLFLTPAHPLVKLAAEDCYSENTSTISIESNGNDIAPGVYPFQIYLWKHTGERLQSLTKLIPVCADTQVCAELLSVMQNAESVDHKHNISEAEWGKLKELHFDLWKVERQEYRDKAQDRCRRKLENLKNSADADKSMAQKKMDSLIDKNEKIITLHTHEIKNIEAKFAEESRKLEEIAKNADIYTTLLVNGVLTVREGQI